jgi:hypothetical protein
MSFTSVLVLLLALPFGLWQAWRRYRSHPFALLLCAAAIGFFGALSLRLVSAAWETGNRASEFLFIGLAFVTAMVVLHALALSERRPRFAPWQGRIVVTALFGLVLVGGAISGWPWDAHLPQPVRAKFEGHSIESEPLSLGRWIGEELPEGRFGASQADARFLLVPGGVTAFAGLRPDIEHTLEEPVLKSWQLPLLRAARVRYVVVDLRRRSHDIVRGYAFGVQPPGGPVDRVLPRAVVTKWEQLPATARLFHSGQIAVFDLEARE